MGTSKESLTKSLELLNPLGKTWWLFFPVFVQTRAKIFHSAMYASCLCAQCYTLVQLQLPLLAAPLSLLLSTCQLRIFKGIGMDLTCLQRGLEWIKAHHNSLIHPASCGGMWCNPVLLWEIIYTLFNSLHSTNRKHTYGNYWQNPISVHCYFHKVCVCMC